MKKLSLCFFAALAFISALTVSAVCAPPNSSHAVILMDAATGSVLYEQNADDRMLIASTTKILTALVVLKNCDLSERVEISHEHAAVEGSSMYLQPGGDYIVEDLLYGLMLASGNDAALALAEHCGGDQQGFAAMMNGEAALLGMTDSSFKNPHGLDADGHYSSARDMAVLTAKALENETFLKIVSTVSHTVNGQTYVNHNRLLRSYPGALGVKTGYTIAAGRSLVSAAERDGARLICVTISDPDDWKDHAALYDWGFGLYSQIELLAAGEFTQMPVISGLFAQVSVHARESITIPLLEGEEVTQLVKLPRFVFAPVSEGQRAGSVEYYAGDRKLAETELYYGETVLRDENLLLGDWERFWRALQLPGKSGYSLIPAGAYPGTPILV